MDWLRGHLQRTSIGPASGAPYGAPYGAHWNAQGAHLGDRPVPRAEANPKVLEAEINDLCMRYLEINTTDQLSEHNIFVQSEIEVNLMDKLRVLQESLPVGGLLRSELEGMRNLIEAADIPGALALIKSAQAHTGALTRATPFPQFEPRGSYTRPFDYQRELPVPRSPFDYQRGAPVAPAPAVPQFPDPFLRQHAPAAGVRIFAPHDGEVRLMTVAPLCNPSEVLQEFKYRRDIIEQGRQLDGDFYLQRVRGGGNCFYLSFLSAWLHHLVVTKEFDKAIAKFRNQTTIVPILRELAKEPTFARLHAILQDEGKVQVMIHQLRASAIAGVTNEEDDRLYRSFLSAWIHGLVDTGKFGEAIGKLGGKGALADGLRKIAEKPLHELVEKILIDEVVVNRWILELRKGAFDQVKTPEFDRAPGVAWDDEKLSYIVGENRDLEAGIRDIMHRERCTFREAYLRHQKQDMQDAQLPEMGVLCDKLCKFTLYERLDKPGLRAEQCANGGRREDARFSGPITLFSSPNHFDVLIPKHYFAGALMSELDTVDMDERSARGRDVTAVGVDPAPRFSRSDVVVPSSTIIPYKGLSPDSTPSFRLNRVSVHICCKPIFDRPSYSLIEELTVPIRDLTVNPYTLFEQVIAARRCGTQYSDPLALKFNFISLCPCKKMTAPMRVFLEDQTISLLTRSSPPGSRSITVVSVGPGGLFQELVYLAKLKDSGYKEIKLVLIDRQPIMVGVLADICENSFPDCQIDFMKYSSLEDYVGDAHEHPDILKPDLLLLIDLDDPQYKIGSKTLADHAFHLFYSQDIMKPRSVIGYSIDSRDPGTSKWIPKAIACSFDGHDTLTTTTLNRSEYF